MREVVHGRSHVPVASAMSQGVVEDSAFAQRPQVHHEVSICGAPIRLGEAFGLTCVLTVEENLEFFEIVIFAKVEFVVGFEFFDASNKWMFWSAFFDSVVLDGRVGDELAAQNMAQGGKVAGRFDTVGLEIKHGVRAV